MGVDSPKRLSRIQLTSDVVHYVQHKVDLLFAKPVVDADPEDVLHHEVGVRHLTDDTVFDVAVGRLAHQIAAEEQPCGDSVALKRPNHLVARGRQLRWKLRNRLVRRHPCLEAHLTEG